MCNKISGEMENLWNIDRKGFEENTRGAQVMD